MTLHPDVIRHTETSTLIDMLQELRIEATWIEVSELKDNTKEKDAAVDLAISINVINQELKARVKEKYAKR